METVFWCKYGRLIGKYCDRYAVVFCHQTKTEFGARHELLPGFMFACVLGGRGRVSLGKVQFSLGTVYLDLSANVWFNT